MGSSGLNWKAYALSLPRPPRPARLCGQLRFDHRPRRAPVDVARRALRGARPAFRTRVLAGTLQRQVSTCELVVDALDGPATSTRTRASTNTTTCRCCASSRAIACRRSGPRATGASTSPRFAARCRSGRSTMTGHRRRRKLGRRSAPGSGRRRGGVRRARARRQRADRDVRWRDRPVRLGSAGGRRRGGHPVEPADPQHQRHGNRVAAGGPSPAGSRSTRLRTSSAPTGLRRDVCVMSNH